VRLALRSKNKKENKGKCGTKSNHFGDQAKVNNKRKDQKVPKQGANAQKCAFDLNNKASF